MIKTNIARKCDFIKRENTNAYSFNYTKTNENDKTNSVEETKNNRFVII